MTTVSDLIEETKSYLLSSHREFYNKLNGAIDDSVTTIDLLHNTNAIGEGSILSVGLEMMYVWSINAATKQAIVERGFNGSTAAAHDDGALITINAKFPAFRILQAINSDLADLSGRGLYAVRQITTTYVSGKMGYDLTNLTSEPLIGLDIRYDFPGITKDWPHINRWVLERKADTDDFPSGYGVVLFQEGYPGRDLRIIVGTAFTPLTALSQDVESVAGLAAPAHDLPPLGAALRLQGVREGQRNFNEAQPDTRRSDEVPPGAQLQGTRALIDFRNSRIRSELARQIRMYPYKRYIT